MIKLNEKVKDFKLPDANNKEHRLSDYLGKKVVIYFYPKNDTPGCTAQACSFRDIKQIYDEQNIVILGISKDSVASHKKFQEKYNLNFTTLSDENLEVIKYFNSWQEKSMFGKKYMGVVRNTFIIDEQGILIGIMEKVNAANNPQEVLDFINNL